MDEFNTLLDADKVSNEWTTENGIDGRKFTDKATGNSIFLPAAGYRDWRFGALNGVGWQGLYWSSTKNIDYVYNKYILYFSFGEQDSGDLKLYGGMHGALVRPVADR